MRQSWNYSLALSALSADLDELTDTMTQEFVTSFVYNEELADDLNVFYCGVNGPRHTLVACCNSVYIPAKSANSENNNFLLDLTIIGVDCCFFCVEKELPNHLQVSGIYQHSSSKWVQQKKVLPVPVKVQPLVFSVHFSEAECLSCSNLIWCCNHNMIILQLGS